MYRTAMLLAALTVVACVSVAIDGFRFGLSNNALQVPILQRAVNPALFPGDPFVATLDKYTSAAWWTLAQIGRVLAIHDWEPIIFVLHVLSRVLFLAGWYALAAVYVHDRRVLFVCITVLGVGMALRGASIIGQHGLMGRQPDHTGFATAFGVFAIVAALRRRHLAAAALAAVAFDINAFVGVWLVPVVVITLWAAESGRTASRRRWLGAAAVYAVLTLPVALWVFSAVAAPPAPGAEPFDYAAFLRDYFPKHFFIDAAEAHELIELGTVVAVGIAALVALGPSARALRACYASWIALFVIGAAAPYLTSSASILNLHLLRMDSFLMIIAAVAAATCAAKGLERRKESPEGLASAVGILAGLATGYWWLTLAGVAVAGRLLSEPTRLGRWLYVATLLAAAAAAWTLFDDVGGVRGYVIASSLALTGVFAATRAPTAAALALVVVFSWTLQPKGVALSLAVMVVAAIPWLDAGRQRRLTNVLLLTVALLGVTRVSAIEHRLLLGLVIVGLLAEPVVHRIGRWRASARAATLGYAALAGLIAAGAAAELRRPGPRDPFAAEIAAWREMQEWVRANTRIGDVFVVPDWPNGFGVWAERSIWVDWKHGAAVMWDHSYYPVYRERRRVQSEATDPVAFARTTGVCFAVADVGDPRLTFPQTDVLATGLPVVFRNDRFAVVSLCGGPRPAPG